MDAAKINVESYIKKLKFNIEELMRDIECLQKEHRKLTGKDHVMPLYLKDTNEIHKQNGPT